MKIQNAPTPYKKYTHILQSTTLIILQKVSHTLQSTTLIILQNVSHTLQSTTLIISQKVAHTLQSTTLIMAHKVSHTLVYNDMVLMFIASFSSWSVNLWYEAELFIPYRIHLCLLKKIII